MDSQSDLLRILVVDDDDGVRKMLTDALTMEGHIVLAVESAEDALSALPQWTFDAALIDYALPGMDGIVLGEFLRKSNPTLKVALVTGHETKHLEKHAKKLGITFLRKPFDLIHVFDLLAEAKKARLAARARIRSEASPDFSPCFARRGSLGEVYRIPSVPKRIEEALIDGVERSIADLKHDATYDEDTRVAALSGLVTASVLGLELPTLGEGRTLYEEYDAIMRKRGRRPEFEEP
jgi:two-component system response regulator (stage 0 sporulation protein F)